MLDQTALQAAVLEILAHILTEGLPYDRCQVGVVLTMPGPQGLSDLYITEADQMPGILRTQIDVVLPDGNGGARADGQRCWSLAEYCDVVMLFC